MAKTKFDQKEIKATSTDSNSAALVADAENK